MRWAIELPSGEFLDTPDNLSLSFELNNQVFSTSDTSGLSGSFTFPVDVVLTKRMKTQLGFPNRVDSASRVSTIENCWVLAGGVRLFLGTLKVIESGQRSAKISIISNPVASLKDTKLPELDLQGLRNVAPATWPDYMKLTVDNPEDYDHIFMPVYNDQDGQPGFNDWDVILEEFAIATCTVTPFVRLDYLLTRIFRVTGWQFSNQFQSGSLELGRLYVFNNVDSKVVTDNATPTPELPDSFSLNQHLPDITCAEFLKKLMAQWGLGLFYNVFTRQIAIIPLKTILTKAARHNWTAYAINDEVIAAPSDVPGYYNYEQSTSIPAEAPAVEDVQLIRTVTEFNDLSPLAAGYYYIETNSVLHYTKGNVNDIVNYRLVHRGVRVGSGSDYQAGMDAIWDQIEAHAWAGEFTGYVAEGTEYKFQKNDYPVALMFYRGLQDVISGGNRSPLCGNSVWLDGIGTPGDKAKLTTGGIEVGEAQYSLNWHGQYGLYEQWHKKWSEMLRIGKHCTQSFIIPLSIITDFSFSDKVRVGDMDFFIKRLRIKKLLSKGRVEVEASLITVI